jgi:hypothetical protein
MFRWLPNLSFVLALVCFLWAGYEYGTQETGPALVIPEIERELVLQPGHNQELVFELKNTGRHPIRVVGVPSC